MLKHANTQLSMMNYLWMDADTASIDALRSLNFELVDFLLTTQIKELSHYMLLSNGIDNLKSRNRTHEE